MTAIESDSGAASPTGFHHHAQGRRIDGAREAEPLKAVGAATLDAQAETGADTSPLIKAGVLGFGFAPGPLHYFDYHHTPADTLDKVDPKELAQDSAAIAGLTWILAE